ncbi:MAG: tRNA-uridine aminocarboxypropyltransferase [Anaeromyxobacteraceae bacterium]
MRPRRGRSRHVLLDRAPPAVVSSAAMRATCLRCLRPTDFCYCELLPALTSRTKVVLLQHPREARLAICSAWLTHLALPGSELVRGVRFDADPRVREHVATPGAALLFPGEGAVDARTRADDPPPVLLVIDGTWHQARKVLRQNPVLAALPRVAIAPERASAYGALRREPAEGCLSTAEAVALALGILERDAGRFTPIVEAFRETVAWQLACAGGVRRAPRHRPAG